MGYSTSIKPPIKTNGRGSWWTSLFVLCAILGALLGLSFKTQNAVRSRNLPSTSYNGLAEVYTAMKQTVADQQRTITALQLNTQKLQTATGTDSTQTRLLADDLKQANFLAGLTSVQGPGLTVTLNDSKQNFPGAPPAALMSTLIHDSDINAAVNELKAAGAEAIAINDQRLVATSPVRCAGPTVLINNIPQTPPYAIRAIGNPTTLMTALNLHGGIADSLRGQDPTMIKIQKSAHMVLPAYAGPTQPRYAKPIAPTQVAKG